MSLSEPFIRRPVGTTLLTVAVALAGMLAYFLLPVSPLPQVEYPSIRVSAGLPGASPETMASSVATPLERQFGRIAGVTEMTSTSYLGSTGIVLLFDLNRNIDAAARDVQAAINAAAGQLPANLPNRPSYRKVNPADAPIMILAMTSDIYDRARMYDVAASILQQKLSQVEGVGQVAVGGAALPAVRVEVNPTALTNTGISLDEVRTALGAANANRPKGQIDDDRRSWSLATTDQLFKAKDYQTLIVAYRNGAAVRLADIASVTEGIEDVRNDGIANGKRAVPLIIFRQPGANIIATVDLVTNLLPQLQASIPPGMHLGVFMDRTTTVRASVFDTQFTLLISVALVVMVVFLFLRDWRSTLIPSVAVPISLIGTFGVMYLAGYSIDNLSLMALTIATGFVVDDAIVVVENVTRYLEKGLSPLEAALKGASEIGFTVVSISVSLIAVFIPILLMGGYVGRMFREFAVTLSVAIAVSLLVSLTTTPMMCAVLLRHRAPEQHGWLYRASDRVFNWILSLYERSLAGVLAHPKTTMLVLLATVAFTVYLYIAIPKDLFPQQDTGRLSAQIQADQNASAQTMQRLLARYAKAVSEDEAVENVVGFYGGSGGLSNSGSMFITLKPIGVRKAAADQVRDRIIASPQVSRIPGAELRLQTQQDLRVGGRMGGSQYQYTRQGDNVQELAEWSPKMMAKIRTIPGVVGVNSDQQDRGLSASLVIDRATASRLGISASEIDSALYNAFGQRQVSTMYTQLNQYHVIMEVDPQWSQSPEGLKHVYLPSNTGEMVPLSAFTHYSLANTSLSINHQGQFPAITISFNLAPGVPLGDAVTTIQEVEREVNLPPTIRGKFAGTAQVFQDAVAGQVLLIIAAVAAVYIVLGILYESLIHPVTILSTLPSAGVGALLALLIFHIPLTVIALIGIILLIGIVKKNAIMMIDFALDAERREGKSPRDAIFQAALLRFRPITMTTMAALLGGLPMALGQGTGSEMRRPLGIAIVGGLILSQALTLYTTPVVYLYMDRLRAWAGAWRRHDVALGHEHKRATP
ncbi:MAG: multidrug efflux RND transporter permease subunit [Planctomycetota bacterium]|nr:multidrug efflux RND transporter permease subunit [Planctomycetota bacterium]